MPICVECGSAVSDLYREFSKGNIRLTQCVRLFFFFGFAVCHHSH